KISIGCVLMEDTTTVLTCAIGELGIFPAIALLDSALQIVCSNPLDSEYYDVDCAIKKILLVAYIITILEMDILLLSQTFQVIEVFTGCDGKPMIFASFCPILLTILKGCAAKHLPKIGHMIKGALVVNSAIPSLDKLKP
uniref:Uncharacterized protein n=1 Tax=Aquila chrysaetos chrysaetos TaxID=223781 RepID=A0A663EP91_AQUCH